MAKEGDKVTAYLPVYAEYAVQVTITGEMLEENGGNVDYDLVLDAAYAEVPASICAHCSGWGKKWNLECDGSEAEIQYVADEAGNTVWGDSQGKLAGNDF